MTENRLKQIQELVKEKGMKVIYKDFTKDEVRYIIDQTIMTPYEEELAKLKYLTGLNDMEVFERQTHWTDYGSVCYHIKDLSKRLRETCNRIFQ